MSLADLAKTKIVKGGTAERNPQLLIYGRNKVGKTTLTATAPNVLIVDPEHGAEQSASDIDLWPATSWNEVIEAQQYAISTDCAYDWVCFDGLTRIHAMALQHVMGGRSMGDLTKHPALVQQRDYGAAGELVKGFLWQLAGAKPGIIYTAQERLEESGDYDEQLLDSTYRQVVDLPRGARFAVNSIVDVIGHLELKRQSVTKNGETIGHRTVRELRIGPHPSLDTGYRSTAKIKPTLTNPTIPALLEHLKGN